MKYYQDITLLPDAETNLGFLWHKVYQQVHLALVERKKTNGNSDIGVSFQEYGSKNFPLGSKLRLFAPTKLQLEQLDIGKWLSRFRDYAHYTSIKEVPIQVDTFVRFKRIQFDTSIERLARRRSKRKGETFEEAMNHFSAVKSRGKENSIIHIHYSDDKRAFTSNPKEKESKKPFILVHSLSKNKRFKLFIEKEEVKKAEIGEFSCYGLGKTATVPWF